MPTPTRSITGPTDREWEVADRLMYLTRNTPIETLLDMANKKLLSGYDRHSLGVIVAPEQLVDDLNLIEKYDEYPGANLFTNYEMAKGINIDDGNARKYIRTLRDKEGVTLIEDRPDGAYLVRNGIILPTAKMEKLVSEYGVANEKELTDLLDLGEEIGGKTLALLNLSYQYPNLALVRLDGSKYMLKDGRKYDLKAPAEPYFVATDMLAPSDSLAVSAYSVAK